MMIFSLVACTKKPNDIGKNFVQNLVDGKTDSAFKAVVPKFSYMTDDGIKAWLNNNSFKLKNDGIKSIEVVSSQEENDAAIVEVKLIDKKDQPLKISLRLKKINGAWLISEVK